MLCQTPVHEDFALSHPARQDDMKGAQAGLIVVIQNRKTHLKRCQPQWSHCFQIKRIKELLNKGEKDVLLGLESRGAIAWLSVWPFAVIVDMIQ